MLLFGFYTSKALLKFNAPSRWNALNFAFRCLLPFLGSGPSDVREGCFSMTEEKGDEIVGMLGMQTGGTYLNAVHRYATLKFLKFEFKVKMDIKETFRIVGKHSTRLSVYCKRLSYLRPVLH